MTRQQAQQLVIFALLVAIGVVGRWGRPDWGFTPLAAVGLFAGRYFANRWLALATPVFVLLVSNLAEPAHTHFGVMLAVFVAAMAPALLGGVLQSSAERRGVDSPTNLPVSQLPLKRALQWGLCVLTPSLLFFVATNSAVWLFESFYPKTTAGLVECLAAGVPFYRTMLAGDLFYTAVLFAAAVIAGVQWPVRQTANA